MNSVNIDSLSKTINGKQILSGINLKIYTKDIIGLLGNNGSGKSILFSILFGTKKSDNIFFKFNNKVIKNHLNFYKIFSLSPQFICLPKSIKVKTLINSTIYCPKDQNEIMSDPLIKSTLHQKVNDLSFGSKKYLQTYLILTNNSPFCLLDEPYLGLSPILSNQLNQLLLKKSNSKGILISEHRFEYFQNIVNKTYLLKNSNIFHVKNKSDLIHLGYLK